MTTRAGAFISQEAMASSVFFNRMMLTTTKQ